MDKIKDMKTLTKEYKEAKESKNGQYVSCPNCRKNFIKKFGKVFCSNGKSGVENNCKDAYWNKNDSKKKNRKHPKSHYRKYNVGEKSFENRLGDAHARKHGYHDYQEMKESQLQNEGFDDGMGVTIGICSCCDMRHDVCRCDDTYWN
jgi:hypothetical protein